MRLIGAHLSISGGVDRAVASLIKMGGNCLQIFSSSPRTWQMAPLVSKPITAIKPVFIHAKYLINLVSDNQAIREKSLLSLKSDLNYAGLIKARGVIVHLGSHKGLGFEAIRIDLIKTIKTLFDAVSNQVELIVENSAGQKGKLSSQLSEISLLLKAINNKRLTWCLDTCHAWGAGLLFGKPLVNQLMQNDLLKTLVCLHVNDSRDEFGSGRDRHANLGEGKIGLEKLADLLNQPEIKQLPLILETPGFDGQGPDKKNLEILKSICV